MKTATYFLALIFVNSSAFGQTLSLVPQPMQLTTGVGKRMDVPAEIKVAFSDNAAWNEHLGIAGVHVFRMTGGRHRFVPANGAKPDLIVNRDETFGVEEYELEISAGQIQLTAASLKGLAHSTATLLQLIGDRNDSSLPHVKIKDLPKLSYRNFMIDMGRNPHSLELLKETIDLLWFYKVDSVQLHLTDDQRIAFPSTAFPKLWDGKITVQQFKQLEAYAVARGVTIIPELEVPGHSSILLRQYPDAFGKTGADLAESPKALDSIKILLDEMMDVFSSSPYIHVGGDEAYGVPEELQRDLINKLHGYLKSKGKQTLVWEGPRPGKGDNKVNTEVIHINWRTINYPADAMLEDGYRVINAAWDPLYVVDHYPRTNFTMTSPRHIYETLSLTRFKHVNPGMPTYSRPIEVSPSDRLIGFCMPWWEGREENFLQQNVPRIIPFAEVAWNPESERDFDSFSTRAAKTEAARIAAFYPVVIEASDLAIAEDGVFHDKTRVSVKSNLGDDPKLAAVVRYTLDGSQPIATSDLYQEEIELAKNATVRAAAFADGKQVGHGSRRNFTAVTPVSNLALGKPVTSSVSSGSPFSVGRITDGGTGNLDFYLGYPATPKPIALTIDLEKIQTVSRVVVFSYTISGSFEKYTVEVSADGETFTEVASRLEKPSEPTPSVEHKFDPRDVRFVRIQSAGNKGYVFDSFSKVTEVQVY